MSTDTIISQELESTLSGAFAEARRKRHQFLSLESVLLSLLDNSSVSSLLLAAQVVTSDLRDRLISHIEETSPTQEGSEEVDTQPTLSFQRTLQRAIMFIMFINRYANEKKEVTGAHLLMGIFGEKDSHAVHFLRSQGLTRQDVVRIINNTP